MGILQSIFGRKKRYGGAPPAFEPPKPLGPPPLPMHDAGGTQPPRAEQPPQAPTFEQFQEKSKNPYDLSMHSLADDAPQAPQTHHPSQGSITEKDIQLLSAKLDTIKSQLDHISARLARLERIAEPEHHERHW